MNSLKYIGFIAGMLIGLFFVVGASKSTQIEFNSEDTGILIIILFPLAMIAIIHALFGGGYPKVTLIYTAGLTVLFAGFLVAFRIVFGSESLLIVNSVISVILFFVITFTFLSVIAGVRFLVIKIAEHAPPAGRGEAPRP